MKNFKFLWRIVLLLFVLAGCARSEPIQTDPPAETTQAVTVKFEQTTVQPATTEPVVLEVTATEPVQSTAESAVPETTSAVPVSTVPATTEPDPPSTVVPILMFHDVKTYPGGPWSMSADNFRDRMEFLLDNGYTPVTFEQLVEYVDGVSSLPEKPVCITFDDGYYSNYKHVLPIITELNIPITVFVICDMVRPSDVEPDPNEDALSKMSIAELASMEASPLVQIQTHTYSLHADGSAEDGSRRSNVRPLASENEAAYKKMFTEDCTMAETLLKDAGVEDHVVFSYPSGVYHRWAEDILRERGYRVSLTTDTGHRNLITVGEPSSLYLLGRLNVNDETTDKKLLNYLNRK